MNWLRNASDTFYRLSDDFQPWQLWSDFVLWSAYHAGHQTDDTRNQQEMLLNAYPDKFKDSFFFLYQLLAQEIHNHPNQNVYLRFMHQVRLISTYQYDYKEALDLLKSWIHDFQDNTAPKQSNWKKQAFYFDKNGNQTLFEQNLVTENALLHCGHISFIDDYCSLSGGSKLIALANAYKELAYRDMDNNILLIAGDFKLPLFSLMAFIQLCIMGLPCYALTDTKYAISDIDGMALFAPPTAVYSEGYCSPIWDRERLKGIVAFITGIH